MIAICPSKPSKLWPWRKYRQFSATSYPPESSKSELTTFLSPPKILENDLQHGSVLSVSLFLIAINDVLNCMTNPVMGLLFADDLTLVCKGENPHTTQILLEETLDKLQKWTQTSGFKFSSTKSETIIFSRKQPPTNINPTLNNLTQT